ncbi:MAG: hypothetical protein K8U03_25470, partial [Planctomycetia bacterium]|nr:hypothetical protein [Planctomycetia bacterium]
WNVSRGAVTWGSGTSGIIGAVTAANSLVGTNANDLVGNGGITLLGNGNFVVRSFSWNGSRGAVTWGSGTSGIVGEVSAANSLVGTTANDQVGSGITALGNGNYVVRSTFWNGFRGAVTWGSGTSGITGAVSAANSLIGSNENDSVGGNGITALTNGNYVVGSANWNGNRGAATWGSGTSGIIGAVSAANSLVGTNGNDQVGGGVTALGNGNYVVRSSGWNVSRGAATWGSGTSGIVGAVSAANSLVGTNANDQVGAGITLLGNGNYVVRSQNWNGSRGAATWGSGTSGITGAVSAANSLIGTNANDVVSNGGITVLSNGNYVVSSGKWNGFRGAVTWGSGTSGVVGEVSAANSLVGTTANDQVGGVGITALGNGNYVVLSANWNDARGAATWGSGTSGIVGVVSAANSLVGTNANDRVGNRGVTVLGNGNYVVGSSNWNGARGAATWGSGTSEIVGEVSAANSLVGTNANDQVGDGVTPLGNGNYVVRSGSWNGSRGAATWGSGTSGIGGEVSAVNSLVGGVPSSGLSGIDVDSVHETFIASFRTDTSDGFGGRLRVGLWNQVLVFTGDFSNFGNVPAQDVTITPGMITAITNNGTAVVLAANTDIVVKQAIVANNPGGTGGHLSLLAGRSILINANIDTDGGDLTLWANHPAGDGVTGPLNANRDAGLAVITMAAGTSIDTGAGNFIARIDTGAGLTNNASGNLTLATVNSGGSVLIENRGPGSAGVWGDIIIASNTITITGGEGTTLRSLGDIYAYVSILNTAGTAAGQGGSVNLIAGWNGVTGLATPFDMTPIFADTASYGNNSGSVYINRENGAGTTGVAVGSRYGATNVAAFDLTLRGGNTDDAYAQLGFRANTSVDFFLIDSPITAVVKNNISVTAGTGLRSYAQVGHGAAFTSNHSGHLYFGEIALTLGGRLALAGVATGDRYSAIGHGDQPGNDDTGDAVGGDVTLRIGQGADLTTAFIGHLIDASGVYFSGKTYISVGTGNYVGTNQTDALVSDAASRINSAANAGGGQLRFYLPQRSSFQMADGTLVNGIDVATFKSSSPLANTQGVFSPFNGPYVVDLSAGNFAFYLSAIPSTGGPTPTPPVDVPVPPNAFSRVFGAILGSIVNDQFGRSEDYFKSIYSLSQGGVRNLGGIDFGPGVGGTITIDVEAESETNLGSEDGALD